MYCAVNYFYPYIHVGFQAQFFKKSFNLKMVARKETNKKLPLKGGYFMSHYIRYFKLMSQMT